MYCVQCGKKVDDNMRFCVYCGAPNPEYKENDESDKTVAEAAEMEDLDSVVIEQEESTVKISEDNIKASEEEGNIGKSQIFEGFDEIIYGNKLESGDGNQSGNQQGIRNGSASPVAGDNQQGFQGGFANPVAGGNQQGFQGGFGNPIAGGNQQGFQGGFVNPVAGGNQQGFQGGFANQNGQPYGGNINPQFYNDSSQKEGGTNKILIIVLAIIAALLVVGLIFTAIFFLKNREYEDDNRGNEYSDDIDKDIEVAFSVEDNGPNTDDSGKDIYVPIDAVPVPDVPVVEDIVEESEYVEPESEYIIEGSDVRYIDRSDVVGLSAEECRIARNEIYARHGRLFDDAELQAYFNSRSWYNGYIEPSDFSESILSDLEMANRDFIVKYEKEMGYR